MNNHTENPDTFSDNALADLRRDALLMVDKCIECGSCYVDCAFYNYGDDPAHCQALIRESNDFIRGNIKKISQELTRANFRCAECNHCYECCPEKIYRRHGNMYMKHLTDNPLRLRLNIHPYSNVKVKQPAIEKLSVSKWPREEQDWYNQLNSLKKADVLLYHGCYVHLQAEQCMKLETLLDAAGISYTAVGKLEYCCGCFGFYRGHSDMDKIKPNLVRMVEKVQPKRILTNCGHCYNAMSDLVRNLPKTSKDDKAEIAVAHAADELLELVLARKLDFAHLDRTFAIHDSCNLRHLRDNQGPLRKLLRRVGAIHELQSHGKHSRCCGDVSRYYDPDHIAEINRQVKLREFVSTGADNLVTVCAGCYENYHNKPELHTVDLIDIMYQAFCLARSEEVTLTSRKKENWQNMSPLGEK